MPGESKRWNKPLDSNDEGDIEASLSRAMEGDPRLAHGAGPARPYNVLDFIQMTGLTAGRIPAARPVEPEVPTEEPGAPISFFEFGVRDVDGSGDPIEDPEPDFDAEAFRLAPLGISAEDSPSLKELKKIIAELTEEADPAHETLTRVKSIEPEAPQATAVPEPPVWNPEPYFVEAESDAPPVLKAAIPQRERDVHAASSVGLSTVSASNHVSSTANETCETSRVAERTEKLPPRPVTVQLVALPQPPSGNSKLITHAYHGLPHRQPRPLAVRLVIWFSILTLLAATVYGAYRLYRHRSETSPAAYRAAVEMLKGGRYREASDAFLKLATRLEHRPVSAEALFMAGYALHLEPESSGATKESYTKAIELFEEFIAENPRHEKTPRAETLMGLLYYKTGDYLAAANILGDPERRLRDPGTALVTQRTLGRTYAALGQMENARSAFHRAIDLETNTTPEQDYIEVAKLYQGAAARSDDPAESQRYYQLAVEQWDSAVQVPGLLKSRKEELKLLREAAAREVEGVAGAEGEEGGETAIVIDGRLVRRLRPLEDHETTVESSSARPGAVSSQTPD